MAGGVDDGGARGGGERGPHRRDAIALDQHVGAAERSRGAGQDLSSTDQQCHRPLRVAREETIAKDPEGLKAFLRATLKGADYAFRQKHFDEGVGYVVKAHPEVDPEGAVGAAQVGARFVYASEVTSGKMAVGQFDPAQLEKTRDLYTQYLELKRKVGLEEIYTNDLLPARK